MPKDFSDVRIVYVKDFEYGKPLYRFKVYTPPKEFGKISGHRFVSLVNDNNIFQNDLQVLLGFIKRQPFIETDHTIVGNKLEQPIIDFVSEAYGFTDVETFGFEDLKNGNDDFHFIRDLEYTNENGERVTGEIKTYSNPRKVGGNIKSPVTHLDWWLQTRLEIEVLKEEGEKGKVFYYFVDEPTRNAVLNDRAYTLKYKNLAESDDIIKYGKNEEDPYIINNFPNQGFKTFKQLMDYAKERRDEMDTVYEDEEGTYYYVEVPLKYPFYHKFDHVKNYLNDIKEQIKIEEYKGE